MSDTERIAELEAKFPWVLRLVKEAANIDYYQLADEEELTTWTCWLQAALRAVPDDVMHAAAPHYRVRETQERSGQ